MKWLVCHVLLLVAVELLMALPPPGDGDGDGNGDGDGDGVYYVSPDSFSCPPSAQSCYNLSYYADYPDDYFTDDSVFHFVDGTHHLEGNELLLIRDVSNLTLRGSSSGDVTITCTHRAGLSFANASNITLQWLNIYNCGGIISDELDDIIYHSAPLTYLFTFGHYHHSHHALLFVSIVDLTIHGITVQYSTGRALSVINTFDVSVSHSSFRYNNINSYDNPHCLYEDNPECYGGNAFFIYDDSIDCSFSTNHFYNYINITDSEFSYGIERVSDLLTGGLGFGLYHSTDYGIDVNIDSVILTGNSAFEGANFFFYVADTVPYHSLRINNLTSTDANVIFPFKSATESRERISSDETRGGGFIYRATIFLLNFCSRNISTHPVDLYRVTITNSVFSHNFAREGAGLFIGTWPGQHAFKRYITIDNCIFESNMGEVGIAMVLWQLTQLVDESHLLFSLNDIKVNYNMWDVVTNEQDASVSTVLILSAENVTFSNVEITNNNITGLHLYDTALTILEPQTTISNNSAVKGGGIYMRGNSELIFVPPAGLILAGNTAEFGGAMYVQQSLLEDNRPLCFFQIIDTQSIRASAPPNSHIISYDNEAKTSGDFLYTTAGLLFNCRFTAIFFGFSDPIYAFNNLLVLDDEQDISSVVSSYPIRSCFCNEMGQPDCSISIQTIRAIPGSYYNITVAAVGLFNGVTPGIVEIRHSTNGQIMSANVYRVQSGCTDISQRLFVLNENTTVTISIGNSTVPAANVPLTVRIDTLPCPDGFMYYPSSGQCQCNPYITSVDITCDAVQWDITRAGNHWISYDNESNCTIFNNCPFDFCNNQRVTFPIINPDIQCAPNRAGVLCGQCADGYSIVMGSNACKMCSNEYLGLLIVFIVAGIALVLLIFILNLTVTKGTINGLIFYANIIKINESNFFPNGPVPILTQFIAWLNLDLGIQACFYDGMTSYAKTWLQFVFPCYIGSIVIIIILLSRYSTKLAKLAGNNAVPVLATLILLSYTKILNVIASTLHMGLIKCDNDMYHAIVWLRDGNVDYFNSEHGFLLVFAVIVLFAVAIPYTLLILCIPLIERKRPRRLNWLFKLTPFFDATCGDVRDDYRFWNGFLLAIRLVLALILPYITPHIQTSLILLVTLSILVMVWNLPQSGIYKKRYLDILESWFLLNLGFMCVMVLNGSGYIGSIISTSLVLITFIAIVIFHIYWRLKPLCEKRITFKLKDDGKMKRCIRFLSSREGHDHSSVGRVGPRGSIIDMLDDKEYEMRRLGKLNDNVDTSETSGTSMSSTVVTTSCVVINDTVV